MRLRSNRDTDFPESQQSLKVARDLVAQTTAGGGKRSAKKRNNNGCGDAGPAKKKAKKCGRNKVAASDVPSTSQRSHDVQEGKMEGDTGRGNRKVRRVDIPPPLEKCISDIPDHIMVTVFTMLPIIDRVKVELVCRRWHYLAKTYGWAKTDTFSYAALIEQRMCTPYRCANERPVIGNAEVKSLARRCGRYLHNLDLHAFRDTLTYNVCSSFASFCPKLRSLNLFGIQLTNSSVQLLGRHCPLLEEVNFHRCFQESIVERGLSSFFSKCLRLKMIDVGENERLSGIPSFSMLPDSVTTLKIGGCYRLTGASMEAIKTRCPNLSSVVMNSVDTLTANELNSFFSSLENLRKLKFGECFISHSIGGSDLNFGRLKNLTELSINDNLLITDRVLSTLANGCKQLKFLDVSGCNRFVTNEGLMELAKLPVLTHINLSMMRITNDETLIKIAERGILQALLLHRCDDVTDVGIREIFRHCLGMTALDVSFCPKVTNSTLDVMHDFVVQREKREAALPLPHPPRKDKPDELVSQMLRHERTLQALMDADFERHMLRFQQVHYRTEQPANTSGNTATETKKEKKRKRGDSKKKGFTPLQVWIGHSGIVQPVYSKHHLLQINDKETSAEHTSVDEDFALDLNIPLELVLRHFRMFR